jgi:hypothetical protein
VIKNKIGRCGPKKTAVSPSTKPMPSIVNEVPPVSGPKFGVRLVIVGGTGGS